MGGRYDEWLANEPNLDDDRLRLDRPADPMCDDCGITIALHPMSVITDDGQSRVYCETCAGARRQAGWLHESRALAALRRSA